MWKVISNALLGVLFSLTLACSNTPEIAHEKDQPDNTQAEKPSVNEESESAAVYSTLLRSMFSGRPEKTVYINKVPIHNKEGSFVVGEGDVNRRLALWKEKFDSVPNEVLSSFLIKNENPANFNDNELRINVPINFEVFEQESKKAVPRIRLSRVGFSSKYDVAFLTTSFWCGWLCGGETSYSLEKKDGEWKVQRTFGHLDF